MKNKETKKELENFIWNVAWLRRQYGFSKKKMAALLGIGVGSINKIERDELPPALSVEVIFTIYRHFGVCPKDQLERRLGDGTDGR